MRNRKILLICFLMLFVCCPLKECDNPTGPDNPPEVKYYNVEITYIREQILNPSGYDGIYCYISHAPYTSSLPPTEEYLDPSYFSKLDEYTFVSNIPCRIGSNENRDPHKISFQDRKRWDGVNAGSAIVASRIILKVVETGFKLELQNIVKCDIKITPYKDDWAKMAQFWLTADGKPKNYK